MILNNVQVVEWAYYTALTAAQDLVVPVGGEGNPQTIGAGQDFPFVTFGFFSDTTTTLTLEVGHDASFTGFDTVFSLAVLASVYTTPYSLPAPLGQNGWLPVTGPYVRWRLVETGGGAALSRFYAKGTG